MADGYDLPYGYLDDIYRLIQAVYDDYVGPNAEVKAAIGRIELGVKSIIVQIPQGLESLGRAMSSQISTVNDNVKDVKDFLTRNLDSKLQTVLDNQDANYFLLADQITRTKKEIVDAVGSNKELLEGLFAGLEDVMSKLIEGFGKKLAESLKELGEINSGNILSLNQSILHTSEVISLAIDKNGVRVSDSIGSLEKTIEKIAITHEEASAEFQKDLLIALKQEKEGLVSAIRDSSAGITLGISTAIAGLAVSESKDTIAIVGAIATLNATIGGWVASEKIKDATEAPNKAWMWAKMAILWGTFVEPLISDPEDLLTTVIAELTKGYYKAGRDVYDKVIETKGSN